MRHFAATLIGALALCVLSPAALAAASPDDAPRMIVQFGDLDLTRLAGAQELYRRIQHAARDVCEPHVPGSAVVAMGYRGCLDQAIARAVADVDAPLLTARHEELTGRHILQPRQAGLNR